MKNLSIFLFLVCATASAQLGVTAKDDASAAAVNGVYNPVACSLPSAPSWCAGPDIGAWINAAIAAGASDIYIPGGTYSQTTTIVLPRYARVRGASSGKSTINFTPTSGWSVVVADNLGESQFSVRGSIEDITFSGPSAYPNVTSQTGGIYFGGSDGITGGTGAATIRDLSVTGSGFNTKWSVWQPITINGTTCLIASVSSSTKLTLAEPCFATSGTWYVTGSPPESLDPSADFGDNFNLNRVRVVNFNVNLQWGNRAWLESITESAIALGGVGLYFPATNTGSGENINVVGGMVANNGLGLVTAKNGIGDVDFHLFGVSMNYNIGGNNSGWQIANGNTKAVVSLTGIHCEQPAQWITSFGNLFISDSLFTNGTNSGRVGYLIDPEGEVCSISSSQLINGGSRTSYIFNPAASTQCAAFNVQWSGGAGWGGNTPLMDPRHTTPWSVLPMQVLGSYFISPNGYATWGGVPGTHGGMYTSWNYVNGQGDSDFFNNQANGSTGGYSWYNCTGSCSPPTLIYRLDAAGTVHQEGKAPTSSAGALTGTNNGGYISGLSAATSVTITFANSGWRSWASCTANTNVSATQLYVESITKTAVTFRFPSLTGTLYYQCTGS